MLTEAYAVRVARDWNVPASCAGFVTRCQVRKSFLDGYTVQDAGDQAHGEYWVHAADLAAFNDALVGEIVVTHEFR